MASNQQQQNPPPDPLRVMHVLLSLEAGGMENGVVNLCNRMVDRKFELAICCLNTVGEFGSRLDRRVRVQSLEKPLGFHWSAVKQLREAIWNWSPDVLHSHNLGPLIYSVGALGPFCSSDSPTLVHGEHAEFRADEKTIRRLGLRKLLYRRCQGVHTVSSGLSRELVDLGFPKKKIRTILNGVDHVRFRPLDCEEDRSELRVRLGIPAEATVLGLVGRFGALKRHEMLIEGFERLAEMFPDLFLLLVGDRGPRKAIVLDRISQSPFSDRIHWAGFQLDPVPWYQILDLQIVPSKNEGLSNAMLESMAAGVPCMAHPACGAAEIITHGKDGILGPMNDASELVDHLKQLLSRPGALSDLGRNARETAIEKFSMEAMLRGYEDLYRESIGGKGGEPPNSLEKGSGGGAATRRSQMFSRM